MDIFYVRSGNVTISDMILDGNKKICSVKGGNGVGSACITNDGGNLILKNCEVTSSYNAHHIGIDRDEGGTGIECFSGNTQIIDCRVFDCDGFGIYVGDWKDPDKCKKSEISVLKFNHCPQDEAERNGKCFPTSDSTVTNNSVIILILWHHPPPQNSELFRGERIKFHRHQLQRVPLTNFRRSENFYHCKRNHTVVRGLFDGRRIAPQRLHP